MKEFLGALLSLLIMAICIAAAWGLTVGIWYLICLCFGWNFSLPIATGIWLVLTLVSKFFKVVSKSKEE